MELFSIPAVAGIIERKINGSEYILIQERWKDGVNIENGLLEIAGGKVREYENVFDCLRREVMEETGLKVIFIEGENQSTILEGHGYKVLNYTPFSCSQNIQGTYPIMVEVFICRASGEVLNETNETKNIRWISLKELEQITRSNPEKFFPMHLAILIKYLKCKGYQV